MLYRSALEDDTQSFHPRRPSVPMTDPPSGPLPHRPASRLARSPHPSGTGGGGGSGGGGAGGVGGGGAGKITSASPERAIAWTPSSPIKEGLGSLNRWSQSTSSSKSPSEYVGHRRDSSKFSLANSAHSPYRLATRVELPEVTVPELRASQMFGSDQATPRVDLSFASIDHDHDHDHHHHHDSMILGHVPSHDDFAIAHPSDGGILADGDGDGDAESRQHGATQKAMLSKALQKANTAVLLDNAANFEGAMDAYTDACQLLQLVMLRSNGGDEERLKLQEIRDTYMTRITELRRMDFSILESDGKALPERPLSQESFGELLHAVATVQDDSYVDSQPSSAHSSLRLQAAFEEPRPLPFDAIPPRRQSLRPTAHSGRTTPAGLGNNLAAYSNAAFLEPAVPFETNETTSWLDTIDESGASSPSSTDSKASSVYLRRRTSRRLSTDTEAEFDAALDAAVEAAYDDGLEPVTEYQDEEGDSVVANARRNIELAKQRVREAELEAEAAMSRGQDTRQLHEQYLLDETGGATLEYLDEEAEEEERLLEEMTKGYVMDEFEFGLQSKSALPRESDSSNTSARTWESSNGSNITGPGGLALSTLTEDEDDDEDVLPPQFLDKNMLPTAPPPTAALPPIPVSSDFPDLPPHRASVSSPSPPPPPPMGPPPVPGVRARRLSGQASTELKIETGSHTRSASSVSNVDPFTIPPTQPAHSNSRDEPSQEPSRSTTPNLRAGNIHPTSRRNPSVGSFVDHITLVKTRTQDDDEGGLSVLPATARPMGKVPSAPDGLDKVGATTKSFRNRNVSVPIPDTAPVSPTTPWSGSFSSQETQKASGIPSVPVLPTPTAPLFTQNGLPTGGLDLFNCEIHSPTSLGRPNLLVHNAPLPLEPCPESFLLRPFWLMRCLYQTLSHPLGGYLSTKLFIPRDVWRVKNVKIKAMEDKISNCDLLTAALLKLAQVDMYDADAVLEEMQSFENILDQAQIVLSKKLGNEVGVHAAIPQLKQHASFDDAAQFEVPPVKSSSTSSKSYRPTWKRLRSKTSGIATVSSFSTARDTNKEHLTMTSVPMTAAPVDQSRRSVTSLDFSGPNSHYMGALARLFDAAQILDQIAQQVEDPGLKHSSPTHVGLELCTRHAAEFFGFYICRFALADVGLMLDKFIKRGSEWVMI
ncbi:Uncharacterized protein PECH_006869 [Penicillium ucsense]|uniref:MIT domain-containing protein n=1 Tax=Penicillium ucsense TaxID=2839758 RepID=A0A8J8W7Y0_9EURO|nr:Uncharacterized protein PECM_006263 [Penicillium ucsense]KAF7735276.1 Uncharacterized protein PECH_006869 [Penicillium ucsense]